MTTPNGQVHPTAEAYRLMGEDELQELADDIGRNGLLYPIVLDHDGAVVDGRNRLAACRLAGVEPRYTSLEQHDGSPSGQGTARVPDPAAYVVSVNGRRRQLTRGQQAMGAVLAASVTSEMSLRALAEDSGVSREPVRRAAVVLAFSREIALQVRDGAVSLIEAYALARPRSQSGEEDAPQEPDALAVAELAQQLRAAPGVADALVAEPETRAALYGAMDRRHQATARRTEQLRQRNPLAPAVDAQRAALDLDRVIAKAAAQIGALLPRLPPGGVGGVGGALAADYFLSEAVTALEEALARVRRYLETGEPDLEPDVLDIEWAPER